VDSDRVAYPAWDVYGALLNSPPLTKALISVGLAIRNAPDLIPNEIRQWGDMVVSVELNRNRGEPETGGPLRVMFI
jgi:hypothetical protein